MTFAASPSQRRGAPRCHPPQPPSPARFPPQAAGARPFAVTSTRTAAPWPCVGPAGAGTEAKPVGRERAGPAAPPSWGNRAGLGLRAVAHLGESPGGKSSSIRQSEASPRDARFPLPRSGRRPGKPVRFSALSAQAKSSGPREDIWPRTVLRGRDRTGWRGGSTVKGARSALPSHPLASPGHLPPWLPWKS